MHHKVATDLLKFVLVFGGLAVVIYAGVHFMPKSWFPDAEVSLISIEDEVELGEVMAEYIVEMQSDLLDNNTIDSAVNIITTRLLENTETSYAYKFKVLDEGEINAFTIPGGRIYMYRGLLEAADTPEELAAVLAHEIGHAEKRHVVDKLAREVGLTVLISIISGSDPNLITEVLQTLLSSAFSRKQEEEADAFALQLLEDSGIQPTALASFFEKLKEEGPTYHEELELLMSHPHHDSRIKMAEEYEISPNFVEQKIDLDWSVVKQAL